MKTRVISACVLLVVVAACFLISPLTRVLFLLAVTLAAVWEMSRALKSAELKCADVILYIYVAAAALCAYLGADKMISQALFFAAVFAALSAGICSEKIGAMGALGTLSVLLYPVVPLIFMLCLTLSDNWVPVFVMGCASAWVCDCFALFGGSLFGKHKLCPKISPNKTVEGSISGAVSSLIVGVIVYFIFKSGYDIPFFVCIITCLVCSTLGQLGDLAASMIKRMTGIKDYSNLIPGHGGIMDRVDSLLFAVPAAYFCLTLLAF